MKATNPFETAIKTYIEAKVKNDQDLAVAVLSTDKNLTDCCSYIMEEVKKLGVSAMTNDEVFAMAKKYYVTKDLKKPSKVSGHVVVGGTPEAVAEINKSHPPKKIPERANVAAATPAPKQEPKPKKVKKEEKPVDGTQLSLFDLMQ
ncbi:Cas9 inhibitor AcrIIA9 family protein [Chryseobacterium sp. SG20098]|uniref:Cas9 inhibitor AcrIIA9 family protein n=1 Tax=Chryseobacterium sp. SG20098 TaxID=3074145 RepID=UPI002882E5CC|nr:Cas9 inhibitor AcrIIA9 family protein [Chryseobacterium sp. SG20098]WNI34678.1 Cas9 inhibitor AcrIIA9 family protein [Chryseobacterium sp. SG20098]